MTAIPSSRDPGIEQPLNLADYKIRFQWIPAALTLGFDFLVVAGAGRIDKIDRAAVRHWQMSRAGLAIDGRATVS
jgi:hypothetical protein